MDGDLFFDLCFLCGFAHDPLHASWREPFAVILAVEQPLYRPFGLQVFFQSATQMNSDRYVSVLASFSLAHVDHVSIEVDIFDEQRTDFLAPQSTAVEHADQDAVFE